MFSKELCVVICFRLELHRRNGLYQVADNARWWLRVTEKMRIMVTGTLPPFIYCYCQLWKVFFPGAQIKGDRLARSLISGARLLNNARCGGLSALCVQLKSISSRGGRRKSSNTSIHDHSYSQSTNGFRHSPNLLQIREFDWIRLVQTHFTAAVFVAPCRPSMHSTSHYPIPMRSRYYWSLHSIIVRLGRLKQNWFHLRRWA